MRKKNKLRGAISEPSEQEIDEIAELIDKNIRNFMETFANSLSSYNKHKHMLSDMLFKEAEESNAHYFAPVMLKFYAIRYAVENFLLAHLLDQWEQCAAEYRALYT